MAVPDTETFSLQDVQTELGTVIVGLVDAFSKASGEFDSRYIGDKNKLLNFRNYVHTIPVYPPTNVSQRGGSANDSFILQWTKPVVEPQTYNIYMNGILFESGVLGSKVETTIEGVPRATAAQWKMTSVVDGNESAFSNPVTVTTARTFFQTYGGHGDSGTACSQTSSGGTILSRYHGGQADIPIVGDQIWLRCCDHFKPTGGDLFYQVLVRTPKSVIIIDDAGIVTQVTIC